MASLMRCSSASSVPSPIVCRHIVEIEQRQGAARDLLGAAIGIAVERVEQHCGTSSRAIGPTASVSWPVCGDEAGEARWHRASTVSPGPIGISSLVVCGALAARTPSVSSLTMRHAVGLR